MIFWICTFFWVMALKGSLGVPQQYTELMNHE